MTDLLQHVSKQPPYGQKLIEDMILCIRKGEECLSILAPLMTPERYQWLTDNDFDVRYNTKVSEWEVRW